MRSLGRSLIGLVILVGLWPAASAHAINQDLNLQISPLPITINTTPGQPASADLRVRNGASQTEKLKITLKSFRADNEGRVTLTDRGSGDDYFDWVSFSRTTFDAPSGEWQTIHMTVNPPKAAAFGYYYAVEYARAEAAKPTPGAATVQGAVVTFVLVNVDAPGAKRQIKLADFSTPHRLLEFLPADFQIKALNDGNIHLAPRGTVFISQAGRDIASLEVNATQGNVLPNSGRIFTTSWGDGFPAYVIKTDASGQPLLDKKGKPQRQLKWDFSQAHKLRFGRYTARLVLLYDDGHRDVPLESVLTFWVVPWRLLGGLVLLVLLVAVGLWSTARRLSRRLFRRRQS
jgi:hypothetical protein